MNLPSPDWLPQGDLLAAYQDSLTVFKAAKTSQVIGEAVQHIDPRLQDGAAGAALCLQTMAEQFKSPDSLDFLAGRRMLDLGCGSLMIHGEKPGETYLWPPYLAEICGMNEAIVTGVDIKPNPHAKFYQHKTADIIPLIFEQNLVSLVDQPDIITAMRIMLPSTSRNFITGQVDFLNDPANIIGAINNYYKHHPEKIQQDERIKRAKSADKWMWFAMRLNLLGAGLTSLKDQGLLFYTFLRVNQIGIIQKNGDNVKILAQPQSVTAF